MGNFIVSARKYRPARFDEVVGQQHVSLTLKNALQTDHLAHAFLFCGPRGVGKTTCARILAKVLNCQNLSSDHEACNECSSCQSFNNNASFNITELDAASNNSVEHIRALIEQVRFQPQQGKYKIFIIDEVHMLSSQAFNAFLKTLEEPPPYALFILATTEKHKIIPTILSRCQIFDFKRIQVVDIVNHLQGICKKEKIDADKNALHIIAQKADGSLRDALSIFDRIVSFSSNSIRYEDTIANLNVLDYEYFFQIVDALLIEDLSKILLIFDEIVQNGFEADHFINGLATHLRNLLVCKDAHTLQLLEVSDSIKARYQKQSLAAPASFLLTALNLSNDCDVNYKMARNKRLHVEMTLIKMTYILRAESLFRDQSQAIEKKTLDTPPSQDKQPLNHSKTVEPDPKPASLEETATASTSPSLQNDNASAVAESQEIASTKHKTNVTKLKSSSKYSSPKLISLDTLEESIDLLEDENEKSIELTNERIVKAWKEYTGLVSSPSVRSTLKKAELACENNKIIIRVGSKMAKDVILQETSLASSMRDKLRSPDLVIEIVIDTSKKPQHTTPPKKLLTTKEKYDKLNELNPLVLEMCKRFDLKIDNDY